METSNSLDEALKNVNLLDDLALCDEQPVIEAPAASITYIPNFDTNFEDSEAFITCNSKYLEEARMHRGLVRVILNPICSDFVGKSSIKLLLS